MKLEPWMRRHSLGIAIMAAVDVFLFVITLMIEKREPQ